MQLSMKLRLSALVARVRSWRQRHSP